MPDLKNLTQLVGELEEKVVVQILENFVTNNPTSEEANIVFNACQEGMTLVGKRFQDGEYFIGDLIFAGELLSECINVLKPVIGQDSSSNSGTIVLGTVFGDLHDIGKNIFKSMAEATGFKIYDIGIDQPVSAFVEKVKEVKPDVVGISGVLTIALDAMKEIVDGLIDAGLRDDIKIIIGGNPVTKEACVHIGSDAFTTNAAEGVKICQGWMTNKNQC